METGGEVKGLSHKLALATPLKGCLSLVFFSVVVAILDVGQLLQKLAQMYMENSSTLDPDNSAITRRSFDKKYVF